MKLKDKVQRSVDSLETIYAVVIGLAITKAIETVLFNPATDKADFGRVFEFLPAMIAFFATIVPFYHGMHRHLSRTYIEETASTRREGFLLLDFFVFFFEACILLVFASSLDTGAQAFIPLGILLIVDMFWAVIAHGIHYKEFRDSPWRWSTINFIFGTLIFVVLFSNLFDEGPIRLWALAILAVCRTAVDYRLCWPFYFPREFQEPG